MRPIRALALTAPAFLTLAAAAAGPISPPAGPIAPTHKTLSQVEPRTPISAETTPGDNDATPSTFKITQPGAYYLTGNLAGEPGRIGIEIAASDVTLDLGGFTLTGASVSGVRSSLAGIAAAGSPARLTILRGTVRNWGYEGLNLQSASLCRIESVRTDNNAGDGILAGNRADVIDCGSSSDGGIGIRAIATARIIGCRVYNAGGHGIYTSSYATITGCTVLTTAQNGIYAAGGSIIADCSVTDAAGHGISLQANATADAGGTVERCTVNGADLHGIYTNGATIVESCTVATAHQHGIVAGHQGVVRNCVSKFNGHSGFTGAGIYAQSNYARIEGNNVSQNDIGILIDGDTIRCLVVRNMASYNTTEYSIVAGNSYGPILSTGAGAIASSNPWANWQD